jgi:hypothetical protein
MTADQDAFKAALALNLSPEATQYLVTVARGEGFYGLGWGNPSPKTIADSKPFGLTGFEGTDSNNWGADQGQGTAGSFPHVDYHKDGSVYVGQYAAYKSAADAAARMARILLKPNVLLALSQGDLHGAVMAQHANGYFELAPEKYYAAVVRNYRALLQNLAWPNLLLNPANISPSAPEVPHSSLPLSSGFLASEWGPPSSGVLSESDLLAHAENYLQGTPNGQAPNNS